MDNPIRAYWQTRLEAVKKNLITNHFEVHLVQTADEAGLLVLGTIIPALSPASVAWGGSLTFMASGLYDLLKNRPDMKVLDTYDKNISREEGLERRRQALLTDLFISGTNAITDSGKLVNLDMIGNRVAALTFGPKHVIVLAGRNKVVENVDAAVARIKNYAAPVNTRRLDKKTPCAATSYCQDCNSPDRVCNVWTITEKCYPKGRVKIILINDDLGF
jgi:L-lactate utilization protein LutB